MDAVGPPEINRILTVTDGLGIHREAVRIPLGTSGAGSVAVNSGRVDIVAPEDGSFEDWLKALADQIGGLDLSAVKRAD